MKKIIDVAESQLPGNLCKYIDYVFKVVHVAQALNMDLLVPVQTHWFWLRLLVFLQENVDKNHLQGCR